MKNTMRLLGSTILAALLAFTSCADSDKSILPVSFGGSSGDAVVSINAIPGVVVPVRGEVPSTTPIETAQYTGTVAWSPEETPFEPETVYTATIALTAKPGFTLTGVTGNSFIVPGATAVNAADSGDVTAVFPATGAMPDIDVEFLSAVETGGASGTADSTGLTLTFDVDSVTLTAEDIIIYGAEKGALTGSGTTRNLAITNIALVNAAPVYVTVTSPAGYSITGSPQTAVVYRLTAVNMTIGMDYRGGKLAYILQSGDPGYDANVPHGIIAAPSDQSAGAEWGCRGIAIGGTSTALGTGMANTQAIVNGCSEEGIAARICSDLVLNGYSDWYLPSRDEINRLIFNRTAIGGFIDDIYWSSSENNADYALYETFTGGLVKFPYKDRLFRVRAIRAF